MSPDAQDKARTRLLQLEWQGRPLQLEYQWVGSDAPGKPVVVFLHEGLGSLAMWKGYPERFCQATGLRGLVWSRPGYGRSTPRPPHEIWAPDFMHRQADEVLPAFLNALGVEKPWLFGHSDGATIALLHAALRPGEALGVVVEAPHVFNEEICIAGIARATLAYEQQGLRERLARYHDDVDSAFYGWNQAWLAEDFRQWNITDLLPQIRCPVLALQGEDDEYGSMEQIRTIGRLVPGARVIAVPGSAHSIHFDQPEALTREAGQFIISNLPQ